jgi:hypothetical protein
MSGENTPLAPVNQRAKLLLGLSSVVFGIWIAAMITMYVSTVYTARHAKPANPPAKVATSAVR